MTTTLSAQPRQARSRSTTTTVIVVVAALAIALALILLGKPDITKTRVENSLNPAFSNLYVQQQDVLGHPGVTPVGMKTRSSCDRGGPSTPDVGAGPDWICMVDFVDNTGAAQEGRFELQIHANSCYNVSGPSKLLGSFTITDPNGVEVTNPVNAFDVCFDPDA